MISALGVESGGRGIRKSGVYAGLSKSTRTDFYNKNNAVSV